MAITIKEYSSAGKILRQKDLRQALYDAGEVLMEKVLVNLHGNEHKSRRSVESKILQPNFFRWYEKEVFSNLKIKDVLQKILSNQLYNPKIFQFL